jgi:threonine dehydrogenase-like Zn-dependent dehydrogenase
MAIDTPARLAILGAGPIGLEAALYARFLGYDMVVLERGEVAEAVRQQGDERLSVPFSSSRSTLGLAAIEAQEESFQPPADDAVLTASQWRERYLLPLSQTDLMSDHLRLHTTVIAVSPDEEGNWSVLSRDASGQDHTESFDGIIDCTGPGSGLPAQPPGEGYYILGSKTAAAGTDFPFADGLTQIRETFAILGDRATLDLYASAARLLRPR